MTVPTWTIPPANRFRKRFSRPACVLAVAVCGSLAAPAVARAASPPGLADAQAQVASALAQVDAVAPGVGAAMQPAVQRSFAMAGAATTATLPAAPTPPPAPAAAAAPSELPVSAPSINTVAHAITSQALGVLSQGPATGSRAAAVDRTPPRPHSSTSLARRAPAATAAAGTARLASVSPTAAGATWQAAAGTTPQAAPLGERASARSSERGRSRGTAPAGAGLPPRPLPPVPPGPSQALTAPAQGGGQGQLVPLLVAALAAVLVFTRFPFRTRLLPRPAFRRPRRVTLAVWHPG
jgi:hypothetical protein